MGSRCQRCSSAVGCTGWSPVYRNRHAAQMPVAAGTPSRGCPLCSHNSSAHWHAGAAARAAGARRSVCDDSTVEDSSGSDGEGQFTGPILLALRPLRRRRRPPRPAPGQLHSRQAGVRMTATAGRSMEDIHSLVHRSYSHSYPQPLSRGAQDPEAAARRLFGGTARDAGDGRQAAERKPGCSDGQIPHRRRRLKNRILAQ